MTKKKATKGKPIRIGIVGIGRAGWGMHCPELAGKESMFRITAACDLIPERRAQMKEKYGCRTYTRIADLIADPEVDLVDIATRSSDHCQHALAALKAGKDVFLEKPITLTYAEALKLKQAAAKSKGRIFFRHNRRYEPAFVHIGEIMASGILGDVFEIKLRRGGYQRREDWQTIKRYGGGQLLNWGPHIVDHGLRLLGAPLKKVWSDLKCIAAAGDAEDHLKIILTGQNGRIVDIEISGAALAGEPEYIVSGAKGVLVCDGQTIRLKYLDPKNKLTPRKADKGTPGYGGFGKPEKLVFVEKKFDVSPREKVDMTLIWDELYDALRNRKKFRISTDEALEVMRVIDLAKKGSKIEKWN